MIGATSSIKTIICSIEEEFPQSSVAVYVRRSVPIGETQPPLTGTSEYVISTPPHPSVASTVITSCSSQRSVVSINSTPKSGSIVSSIVNVDVVVEAFPHSSVAEKVTVADPVAPQSSDKVSKLLLQAKDPQRSLAEAPPLESSHD